MWDCAICRATSIIVDKFCPHCFTARPTEPTSEPVTEVGEMAESDSKATDAPGSTEVAPEAEPAGSDAGNGPEAGRPAPSGPSEAVPSAGGFLTDWGR